MVVNPFAGKMATQTRVEVEEEPDGCPPVTWRLAGLVSHSSSINNTRKGMAHFAELDEANTVIRVIVVGNANTMNADGEEDESVGAAYCQQLLGGIWKRTSYNTRGGEHSRAGHTPFRKNYAGKGYTYDEDRDAFIPPNPFSSWLLNEDTCYWEAPVPVPDDITTGKHYRWNEDEQQWDEMTND